MKLAELDPRRGSTSWRGSRRIDVGKPIKQGRADALAMARYMEFYAGAADKVMGETIPYLDGYTVYTLREPHGVTGHIVPWNYPMQIAGRTIGAALAMGNACVLKPAEEACLTSLALADLAREAGFPAGRAQCRAGPRRGGGRGARRPSGRPPSLLHRLGRGRRAGSGGGRPPCRAGDARTRRQVAAARLRRRRPRARPALPGQRRDPECRADLLGRLAHPHRALALCGSRRAHGGALPGASRRAGRGRSRRRAADLGAAEGDRRELHRGGRRSDHRRARHRSSPTRRAAATMRSRPCSPTSSPDHRLAQEEIFGPVQVAIPFDDEADAAAIANGTGLWSCRGRLDRGRGPPDAARQGLARRARSFSTIMARAAASNCRSAGVGKSGHGREKGFRGALRLFDAEDRRGLARLKRRSRKRVSHENAGAHRRPAALALTDGCALAPEFKTFHLSHRDWRGTALDRARTPRRRRCGRGRRATDRDGDRDRRRSRAAFRSGPPDADSRRTRPDGHGGTGAPRGSPGRHRRRGPGGCARDGARAAGAAARKRFAIIVHEW